MAGWVRSHLAFRFFGNEMIGEPVVPVMLTEVTWAVQENLGRFGPAGGIDINVG